MAQVKITELTAQTDPSSSDVLPLVSVSDNETKKVTVADLLENAGDGTVSAPAFSFDSDKNTGIYRPGADQVAISVGGSQALLVQSSGVTVPGNLTIEGTTTTIETTNLVVEDKNIQLATVSTPSNTTADGGGITLKGATDKTITWVNSTGCWTFNQPMNFNDHVRIDSSGNVGVGTASPTQKLHVVGITKANSGFLFGSTESYLYESANDAVSLRIGQDGPFAEFIDVGSNVIEFGNASGELALTSSGTEKVRIKSDGNVGIGNTSPSAKLQIEGTSDQLKLTYTSIASYIHEVHSNGDYSIAKDSNERLRIDSSGRLLVGTTSSSSNSRAVFQANTADSTGAGIIRIASGSSSPSDGNTLGAITFTDSGHLTAAAVASARDGGTWTSGSSQPARLVFSTCPNGAATATERMRIDSSGRVGIRTSSMGSLYGGGNDLVIGDGGNDDQGMTIYTGSSRQGIIAFADGFTGASQLYAGYLLYDHSSDSFRIATTGQQRLLIDSSGNVGIGETNPSSLLHLSSASSPALRLQDTTNDCTLLLYSQNSNSHIGTSSNHELFFDTNGSQRMMITTGGNVGIGSTAPRGNLHLHSSSATRFDLTNTATGTNSTDGSTISIDGSTGALNIIQREAQPINFSTSNTQAAIIDSSGRLLVGTSAAGTGAFGTVPSFHVASSSSTNVFQNFGSTTFPARIDLCKTRGTSANSHVVVQNSDTAGGIYFSGSDGTDYAQVAQIEAFVDGAPGNDDMPGRLVFSTTPDGAQYATERMRIDSSGDVQARRARSNTSGDVALSIQPSDSTIHYGFRIDSANNNLNLDRADNNSTLLTVDASGNLGVGTSTPSMKVNISHADQDGLRFNSVASGETFIDFADPDDNDIGRISYDHSDNHMSFRTNNGERLHIDSSGNVGIGRTSASSRLDLEAASGRTQITLRNVGNTSDASTFVAAEEFTSGNADLILAGRHNVRFFSNLDEKMRIDSSGRLLLGNSSSNALTGGFDNALQVEGTSAGSSSIAIIRNSNDVNSPYLNFGKSRGTSVGSNTIVGSTDTLAIIDFTGSDGSGNFNSHANIRAEVDGTPGNADSPGRLTFWTTPDGSASPEERLRINSSGLVGINETSPAGSLHVDAASGVDGPVFDSGGSGNNSHAFLVRDSADSQLLRVNNNGKTGIKTSSPDGTLHVHTNSAGSVTASTAADDLVVENNGDCGISILTADGNNNSAIFFGTPNDSVGAAIRWNDDANQMMIGPDQSGAKLRFNYGDGTEGIVLDSSGRLLVKDTTAGTYADFQNNTRGEASSTAPKKIVFPNQYSTSNDDERLKIYLFNSGTTRQGFGTGSSYDLTYHSSGGTNQANHVFFIDGSEKLRIDPYGRLLVGTSSVSNTNVTFAIQGSPASATSGPQFLMKRDTATPASGNSIGSLAWSDNTDTVSLAITGRRDGGTWSASSKPSKLEFSTCADGASSPTVRMQIGANGVMSMGDPTTNGGWQVFVADNGSANQRGRMLFRAKSGTNAAQEVIQSYIGTTQNFRLRADGGAYFASSVGIGTTSPASILHTSGSSDQTVTIQTTTSGADSRINFRNSGGTDAGGIHYKHNGNHLAFNTGGSNAEQMRIDGSGRLLVGTTSARTAGAGGHAQLQVKSPNSVTTDQVVIAAKFQGHTSTSSSECLIACSAGYDISANDTEGQALFGAVREGTGNQAGFIVKTGTSNTERLRIASDGKISIGSTGDPSTVSTDDPKVRLMPGEVSVANHQSSSLHLNRTGNNGAVAKFFRNGTQVGRITVDTSSTSYVTSSDYRLKENVVELSDGIARVKQLAPKRFNFIVDADTTVDGFLAHEAQAVVPEAVTGERDGEEMQGIDQSKLVPLLTAALQEAIAKIETLEQRLTDAGL